ncbi:MAG TPA: SDR family oxidoreductase, partial [Methanosarcinales archaeon]|nr:SDR family oxidoreductase [Methanosarcinales archaeon]
MKTYITGANGFVGSHLVKALNKKVICIPHSEIMKTKLEPFDSLYFLSTYGNMYSHTDEKKILQANVGDLIHLLLEAKSCGFKSFVYISTSSVELEVQTMYSRAKKAAEEILLAFIDKYDLPICIIRPFSITGVGEQKQHLIPTLINACFTGEIVNFVSGPQHDYI